MNSSRLQQKSVFTSLKYVTKAGVMACSVMSVKICLVVFMHFDNQTFRTCAGSYSLTKILEVTLTITIQLFIYRFSTCNFDLTTFFEHLHVYLPTGNNACFSYF